MLVALPIFSSAMRDMASDISGMNRKLSATPCRHLRPENVPEARIQIQPGELEHSDRAQPDADQQQASWIGLGRQMPGQRRKQQRSHAPRRQRQARVVRGISHQRLQIKWQQDQAGVENKSQHADQKHSRTERAIGERAQIDDGMIRHQFANHQRDQPERAEPGENLNVLRRKPIFALPRVEHHLQRSDAQRQESNSPKIDAAVAALHVMRIEHEPVHQEKREHAHRQVEIKNPAPAVVISDPSAKRGPENRRQQNAEAERRHGMAVPLLGKSFEQDRLRQRLQSAARQPLQHAENNQLRQRCRHAAAQRREGESGDTSQQQPLASESVGQPSRDRQHDRIRNQVGRDHPRPFFIGRGQVAGDVRNGNVDDRGVEHFHEGRQHHRTGDDPRIYAALWIGIHQERKAPIANGLL